MNQLQRYRLILVVLSVVFLYLVSTEVPERWGSALTVWAGIREKQDRIGDPEQLGERRDALLSRRELLSSSMLQRSGEYEQTQTGVFEFLTACARQTQIRLESVTPLKPKANGQHEEIPLVIQFHDTFHRIGTFINIIENGAIPVKFTKLEIATRQPAKSQLEVKIEAIAYVYILQGRGS